MRVRRDQRLESYALVVAATPCYTALLFVWFSLPASLSIVIAEVGLTGTQAGILAGAVPLTYVPLALFSGLAIDRIGPGRGLAGGLAIVGLAQVARSAAPGFPALLGTTLLVGVGGTAITFGLPKLVSVRFPPDRTGFPSSIYLVGAAAGTAGAFAVGRPVLVPLLGGWRPLFFWSGIVAIGYATVWLAAARVPMTGGVGSPSMGTTVDAMVSDLRAIVTHRELQLVVVVGAMYLLVVHGMQGWLPTVLESRGIPPGPAGEITSLLVAANVAGILVVPAVADRIGARRPAVIGSGAVAFIGIVGILIGAIGPLVLFGVIATGFGVGGLSPLVRAIPPGLDGIGARLTGTAVGFVFAVGEIGGFLGPFLVGALRDLTGSFGPGLATLAIGAFVVMMVGGVMDEDV